jgi:hypothetical protein
MIFNFTASSPAMRRRIFIASSRRWPNTAYRVSMKNDSCNMSLGMNEGICAAPPHNA